MHRRGLFGPRLDRETPKRERVPDSDRDPRPEDRGQEPGPAIEDRVPSREDQREADEDRGKDRERRGTAGREDPRAGHIRFGAVHASDPDDESVEQGTEEEKMSLGPPDAVREHEERDTPEEEAADRGDEDLLEPVRASDRDREGTPLALDTRGGARWEALRQDLQLPKGVGLDAVQPRGIRDGVAVEMFG